MGIDPELLKYCKTESQREKVQAAIDNKTVSKAAQAVGVDLRNMQRALRRVENEAARHGWTKDGDETRVVRTEEKITIEEEHNLKTKVKRLNRELKEVTQQYAETASLLEMVKGSDSQPAKPMRVKRGKKKHQVAATAFLSDTHFDEAVSLAETGGVNQYSRKIAEQRLERFAEKTVVVAKDLMSGFDVVHLDLPFGGDMVSGNIHEELARTNQAEIMDTVQHWSGKLASMVVTLSKEFPTVFIPCVVGNHGRNTRKPRHKGRIQDNFDWLIYCWVRDKVKASGVKNVTFDIGESTDVLWETMGHKYLLTHGDQASGGAGWGGIFSPIMRLHEKKLKSYAARGLSFDYMIMGHWHQLIDAGPVLVNGTTKGFDEFAHNLNFRPEPPQQAFWLTDPEKGKIFSGPLFVADGEKLERAA